MTKDEMLHRKPNYWQGNNVGGLFESATTAVELISEEKRPSLYSVSLTDSICSDSTIDLEAFEQSEAFYSINDTRSKIACTPVKNNFTGEKTYESLYENAEPCKKLATEAAKGINKSVENKFRKCMSLHDLSNLLPLQMTAKSTNTVSCETIHSQSLSSTTKSKDSGFQRSVSCLSLTSGRRNYDHVQSKVKEYIRNIKESEALRKKNKFLQKAEESSEPKEVVDEVDAILDKEDLIVKIQELKQELHEKALYIDTQQKNYNSLLLKLAEAKNTIDVLRLQRLTLNYSSTNESRNLSSRLDSFNLDVFEEKIKRKWKQTESIRNPTENGLCKETGQEQLSFTIETPNTSLTEVFSPRKHSTPHKNEVNKNLSPVCKIFCSSSRLDKNYKPLSNLNKHRNISSGSFSRPCSNTNTESECRQCSAKSLKVSSTNVSMWKSRKSASRTNSCHQKSQSTDIDLPNDDPFDKVKKWQASLPSINLLGTHSSSDHELSETSSKKHPAAQTTEGSVCTVPKSKDTETDINCFLAQELITKCRISEMDIGSTSENFSKSNQNLETTLGVNIDPKHTTDNNDIDTELHSYHGHNLSNENTESHFKTNEYQKGHKPLANMVKAQVITGNKPKTNETLFKNQRTNFPVPIDAFSSISDSESQSYLPKSSSLINTVDKTFQDHSSDSSDDSSSISSSVLSSKAPSSPSKRSKRRSLSISENCISSKVLKLTGSKTKQTNFVLREPMLNVNVALKSVSELKNQRISQNKNTNSNGNKITDFYFKTESSQRKAWNARNSANFFVCKDFYFKKSSSMGECLNVMGEMMENGYSIIKTALNRSNC